MRPTPEQRQHLRRLAQRQGIEVPFVRTAGEASRAIGILESRRYQLDMGLAYTRPS